MLALLLACEGSSSIPNDTDAPVGHDTGAPDDSGLPGDSSDTGDTGGEDTGREKPDCGDIVADDVGYAALFDTSVLHELTLTLSAAEVTELGAEPTKWAEAAATIDGVPLSSIGVKWRGDSAQMRWDGKPSWTLGLRDQYACDTVAGLDRLELDAMGDDPAQVRAVLESQVMEGLGRVQPHVVFAMLTVNDEPFGLYALVEAVDVNFVTHRYGAGGASLWSADAGADFTTAGLDAWNDETGSGDPEVLQAVADVVAGSGSTFYADLGAVLDVGDFAHHWAALAAVGDLGAWPYETDDVDLVLAPGGALQFVADKPSSGWNPEYAWNRVDSALGVRCSYDTACAAAVGGALSNTAADLDDLDVPSILAGDFALTDAAVADDPRRPAKVSTVNAARDALVDTVAAWPDELR